MLALFSACTEDGVFRDDYFTEQNNAPSNQIMLSVDNDNIIELQSQNVDIQNSTFAPGTSFSILTMDENNFPLAENVKYNLGADGSSMLPSVVADALYYQKVGKVKLFAIAPFGTIDMTKENVFEKNVLLSVLNDQSTAANVVKSDLLIGKPKQENPFRNELSNTEIEFQHAFTRIVLTIRIAAMEEFVCDNLRVKATHVLTNSQCSLKDAFQTSLKSMFQNAPVQTTNAGEVLMIDNSPITIEEVKLAKSQGKNFVERKCECVIMPDVGGRHLYPFFQVEFVNGSTNQTIVSKKQITTHYLPGKSYSYIFNITEDYAELQLPDFIEEEL